jgi:glucose-1-phosphate cytidylyltransferase
MHNSDLAVDLGAGTVEILSYPNVDWRVRLIDTGLDTMTGGRIKRLEPLLRDYDRFHVTYGDGVCDVDVRRVEAMHASTGTSVTMTVVRPPGRFGMVSLQDKLATDFVEKPEEGGGWINGGFFVMSQKIFEYLGEDGTVLEREPLGRLARDGELSAYRHDGFWQCMDTLRDKQLLDEMCNRGEMPWLTPR